MNRQMGDRLMVDKWIDVHMLDGLVFGWIMAKEGMDND